MLATRVSPEAAGLLAGGAVGDAAGLLGCIGLAEDLRVLLIGPHMLETMCALLRGGCTEVVTLHAGDRAEPGSADVIVAAEIGSLEAAELVLAQARRAAVPLARVILQLSPAAAPWLAGQIGRALLLHGFVAVRGGDRTGRRIEAERPLFGRLAAHG